MPQPKLETVAKVLSHAGKALLCLPFAVAGLYLLGAALFG
jgi:hypothetical protein